MTSKRPRRAARRGDDILCFAPRFTVYVLPSNSVCLYSEDRKFFLHGELYCALAVALGSGKGERQLVRELERKFPSDAIAEALKRLKERRFVVARSRSSATVAGGYWATLGLAPEAAEKSLEACRVRIQAIDVRGAAEIGAALKSLGVRVVKGAADLTVTLVADYLDGRLAERNKQHLSERSSWLLVQPSGVFPLVGPVLRPGTGACWVCMSERMRRNREVRAMLDRGGAQCVVTSPLARDMLGRSGIELAALEIAKAIVTGFRTDLSDHIVSLDLMGTTVERHHVAARPQCPACGRKALRNPARAPSPITLAAGARLTVTSGGYRTVSSRATVARFRKHVSPLTGVVSRLERIEIDLPLNTNWYATHNFSARPVTVDELRAGLGGGSFGKGSTAEQGEASALMEAIERYSGIYQGDEIRRICRFTDFSAGEAIPPNDVLLFSDAQYGDAQHRHGPSCGSGEMTPMAPPFDPSVRIDWSPVWSLGEGRFRYLPTSLLYFFYTGDVPYHVHADSNGCAAGNTLEEAIVQGFLELIERDAYAIWWYNRSQRAEVDLDRFDDPYIHELKAQLAGVGRRVWALDVTSDLGIPTYVTVAHWMDNGREFVDFGSGAHFDARIAMLRAMTELSQFLSIERMGARSATPSRDVPSLDAGHDGPPPFRLQDHVYLTPSGGVRPNLGATFGALDTREQAMACVDVAARAGLDLLALDQTRPDIEVPVVRVVVPGLRHFYRRFAPGRLYDVPVRLGLRRAPLAEHELNPFHPQT